MILFRRIGGSFREITSRDWALLSLETLGIIAGILIAFQLNEWGAARKEAAKHRQLMERLFEESTYDVAVLASMRDNVRERVDKEVAFATNLAAGRCPAQAEWKAVGTLAMYPALTAPTSVYEELMGAGGLSAVDNPSVRHALTEFHGNLDWVQRQVEYFRSVRPYPINDSDPRISIHYDPTKDDPQVETYNREALCSDHAFRNLYAASTRQHYVFATYFDDMTDFALNMCAVLGESIGKSCADSFPNKIKRLTPEERKTIAKAIDNMRKHNAI